MTDYGELSAVYNVPYKSGSKRIRKHETREDFVKRVQKTFPTVIVQVKGNFEFAAMVYSLEVRLLEAIIGPNKACRDAYTRARAKMSASKEAQGNSDADAGDVDKRLKRRHWPRDPDERLEAVRDALMTSLFENEGDVEEVSDCLNLPVHEIAEMLEADEELRAQKDRGLAVAVIRSEASLTKQARKGNVTAIKKLLESRSDEWDSKQGITVKHEGFAPPSAEETAGSVLSIVRGEKDESA